MDKQTIDDQKKTIHRLQEECTEKTNAIIALGEKLKAKEQECEELKSENFTFEQLIKDIEKYGAIEELIQQLDQLKVENDELRKNLVDKHTLRCFRLVTHREFDKLTIEKVQLRQENKKLKQTLTEIKELCQKHIKAEKIVMANDILQKISEVEE